MNKDNRIAIVGGGIVGASLALALSTDKQLSISFIDAGSIPQSIDGDSDFDPRCIALNQCSIDLLTELNVWPAIVNQRYCEYHSMHVWEYEGTGVLDFEDNSKEAIGTIVENKVLCAALWQQLATKENITILAETEAVECRNNEGVTLVLNNNQTIRATLLCIADGTQSHLRQQLKFATQGFDCPQSAMAFTVQIEQSHQYAAWQRFLPTGPVAFLPLPPHPSYRDSEGKLCSVVWSIDNEQIDDYTVLSDSDFATKLAQAIDYRFGELSVVGQRFCFPLSQQQASEYIKDNTVLVGDCAHSIHPLAGQGANLGLADVIALSQVIQQRQGLAINDSRLLRRYVRQRQLANWTMGGIMDVLRRIYGSNNPQIRLLRNSGMNLINSSPRGKQFLASHARYG